MDGESQSGTGGQSPVLCKRCQTEPQSVHMRGEDICQTCFIRFVSTKAVKRLEALQRLLRIPYGGRAKYLLGLSFGTSSTALLHMIDDSLRQREEKGRKALAELVVVHVDAEPESGAAQQLLDKFRKRYPGITFYQLCLSSVLELQTVDWSALPPVPSTGTADDRLQAFLRSLPSSTSSRLDVTRLLTRHVLVSAARQHGCHALILGCSTTALAELALSETAQGRGFSSPWLVDDGLLPLNNHAQPTTARIEGGSDEPKSQSTDSIMVYYPLREVFRKELVIFARLVEPPLTNLILDGGSITNGTAVTSHKDLGIQDVVARYFEGVEEQYPSVVANVVKTMSRLQREQSSDICALCGLGLNPAGDEAWSGEMGMGRPAEHANQPNRLCYGCQRTMSAL